MQLLALPITCCVVGGGWIQLTPLNCICSCRCVPTRWLEQLWSPVLSPKLIREFAFRSKVFLLWKRGTSFTQHCHNSRERFYRQHLEVRNFVPQEGCLDWNGRWNVSTFVFGQPASNKVLWKQCRVIVQRQWRDSTQLFFCTSVLVWTRKRSVFSACWNWFWSWLFGNWLWPPFGCKLSCNWTSFVRILAGEQCIQAKHVKNFGQA